MHWILCSKISSEVKESVINPAVLETTEDSKEAELPTTNKSQKKRSNSPLSSFESLKKLKKHLDQTEITTTEGCNFGNYYFGSDLEEIYEYDSSNDFFSISPETLQDFSWARNDCIDFPIQDTFIDVIDGSTDSFDNNSNDLYSEFEIQDEIIPDISSNSSSILSIRDLPIEDQNFIRQTSSAHLDKIKNRSFVLGTESFSFSPESRDPVLETFLTMFASNSRFLMSLITSIKSNQFECRLEKLFVLILLQILLGCKNISLISLKALIQSDFDNFKSSNSNLQREMLIYLNFFCKKFSKILIHLPMLKKILYSELITDEPLKINVPNLQLASFNPIDTIKPRPGHFSGVILDENKNGNRLRSVLFSEKSLIFPIITPRMNGSTFIDKIIEPFTEDHIYFGCIKYGSASEFYFDFSAEFLSNHSKKTIVSYNFINGPSITKYNSEEYEQKLFSIKREFFQQGFITFAMKSSDYHIEPINSAQIPREFLGTLMAKIRLDCYSYIFHLKHQKKFRPIAPRPCYNKTG